MERGIQLDVTVVPAQLYVSWTFAPAGSDKVLTWEGADQDSAYPSPPVRCSFSDDSRQWTAWPFSHDRKRGRQSHDLAIMTVYNPGVINFATGRPFDFFFKIDDMNYRREYGGVLVAPTSEPEWLTRLVTPNSRAFQPWISVIRRAQVSEDGSHLWLQVPTDRGEIPASVDVEETGRQVEVYVRVGIDPAHPPRPPSVGRSSRSGQSRAKHTGVAQIWHIRTALARPLADRPVFDMGYRDISARRSARSAWHRAAGGY
ncbi:conserved hypothetical protein [Frankia sp. AiPs1]